MDGLAQVYFYAYMDKEDNFLVKVRIVNVTSIRKLTQKNKFKKRKNNDGTEFNVYLFSDIKKENGNVYKYN